MTAERPRDRTGSATGDAAADQATSETPPTPRAGSPEVSPHPAQPAGPVSILECATCGRKNKIRPSERGAPHCGSCGAPLPWLVAATDDTFDIEARAAVSVLVDLWAPWCGPCRYVAPVLADISREYAGRIKVVKVNVDESPMVASRFDARSIPTLVVLRNGRVVDRIVGALPKSQLVVQLMPHLLRR